MGGQRGKNKRKWEMCEKKSWKVKKKGKGNRKKNKVEWTDVDSSAGASCAVCAASQKCCSREEREDRPQCLRVGVEKGEGGEDERSGRMDGVEN